jgi:hypothetical protein
MGYGDNKDEFISSRFHCVNGAELLLSFDTKLHNEIRLNYELLLMYVIRQSKVNEYN